MTKILFTNTSTFLELEQPKPASNFIPSWYKEVESYVGGVKKPNGDGGTTGTIKRCMPVFDAITAGYIITLPADVYVSLKNGEQYFEWSNFKLVDFHPVNQAPNHPAKKPHAYAKWINFWAIKTPKGYSTLFVHPMHHDLPFTILPGIVDTDEYYAPVNFPMVINDPTFEGLIPKGTPIAQVIPFKRESWSMEFGGEKENKEQETLVRKLKTKFFDGYKSMFRVDKEYK
jgi:hypothetical protein